MLAIAYRSRNVPQALMKLILNNEMLNRDSELRFKTPISAIEQTDWRNGAAHLCGRNKGLTPLPDFIQIKIHILRRPPKRSVTTPRVEERIVRVKLEQEQWPAELILR